MRRHATTRIGHGYPDLPKGRILTHLELGDPEVKGTLIVQCIKRVSDQVDEYLTQIAREPQKWLLLTISLVDRHLLRSDPASIQA